MRSYKLLRLITTNDLVRTFPSNLVARMHRIEIKPFFDGKNMEDDIVNDFKF